MVTIDICDIIVNVAAGILSIMGEANITMIKTLIAAILYLENE